MFLVKLNLLIKPELRNSHVYSKKPSNNTHLTIPKKDKTFNISRQALILKVEGFLSNLKCFFTSNNTQKVLKHSSDIKPYFSVKHKIK